MNLEVQTAAAEAAEAVGAEFNEAKLLSAQAKSWQAIREVASAIKPGMSEAEALILLKESLKNLGYTKMWHPPQIRFGENTLLPFAKPSNREVRLAEDDVFFLDIGPLFDGYEGDAGQTFAIGNNAELHRLSADAKRVFEDVKLHWQKTRLSGPALYDYASEAAEKLGWELSLHGASGHRVSEFPHALHHKGKLKSFDGTPKPNRWILEIHLISKRLGRGAFFEDLL